MSPIGLGGAKLFGWVCPSWENVKHISREIIPSLRILGYRDSIDKYQRRYRGRSRFLKSLAVSDVYAPLGGVLPILFHSRDIFVLKYGVRSRLTISRAHCLSVEANRFPSSTARWVLLPTLPNPLQYCPFPISSPILVRAST